jgi:hypothetical protein
MFQVGFCIESDRVAAAPTLTLCLPAPALLIEDPTAMQNSGLSSHQNFQHQ